MDELLQLITLNGKTVGTFEIEDGDKVVMKFDGGVSLGTMLDRAQRTGQTLGLRMFQVDDE